MKRKSLFLIAPLLAVSALAQAQNMAQETLNQYFPIYNKPNQCWVANTDQGTYCMKVDASKTVDTPDGKKMYLLTAGDLYDFNNNKSAGGHASSGNVAMFVLEQSQGKWRVASAKTEISVGAFATAPKKWTFHQFGPQTYGFLNKHFDVHQGYAGSHYVILTPEGKTITEHWIGATVDNEGAEVNPARLETIDSQIKVDRSKTIKSGLYPLTITLNGVKGKKKITNRVYTITYDAKKKMYAEPKDYLLKDIDY